MFWKNLSLQDLGRGAVRTFARFPLTLLSAFFGVFVCFLLIGLPYNSEGEEQRLMKLVVFAWLGLILFFDLELISERYGFRAQKRWLIFLGGLLALIAYYLYLPPNLDADHAFKDVVQLFLFGLGLHLLASFAPYFNPKTEHGFWQFNEKLFLRFLTATLYSGVLFVGLVVAIVAVRQLFQVEINDKVFARLWVFMAGVFHPWFFLAGVPQNLQALETEDHYPKGLKVFTQFVLLPLVTVYLLILYGYLAKIIIQWSWPRGWVSNLVLSFSIVGIFSLLLIHPIRNLEGNTWIRTYAKWFYRALFPLLILFALAIWRRVSDYGITEERYFVLALALWLLIVALYFLFSRQKNIKFIPVTLCLLAFLVAFGPWGAFAVSERSQTNRLKFYLEKNGMLSGGKTRPARGKVPVKDEAEISSILGYLGRVHNFKSLQQMLGPQLAAVRKEAETEHTYSAYETEQIMRKLNLTFRYTSGGAVESQSRYFGASTRKPKVSKTTGFDYQLEYNLRAVEDHEITQNFTLDAEKLTIRYTGKSQQLWFRLNADSAVFDLNPIIKKYDGTQQHELPPAVLTYYLNLKNARLKLYFVEIYGKTKDEEASLENFTLQLQIKMPLAAPSESAE